jgi:hypothetical protein
MGSFRDPGLTLRECNPYGLIRGGRPAITEIRTAFHRFTAHIFDSDAKEGRHMFQVKEIVKTSGKGRTADWPEHIGTVTSVTKESVFVQWDNYAVEDEMSFDELFSTRTFADKLPVVVAELPLTEEESPTIH